MDLLKNGSFVSRFGRVLLFKIECDALTDEDIETVALRIAAHRAFSRIVPIPSGGLRLASALKKYLTPHGGTIIVDDVFTTGGSMEEARAHVKGEDNVEGYAIYARGICPLPSWVKVIFQTSPWAEG